MPTPQRASAAVIVTCLALLLGLQPVTTDLYLPALPMLKQDLRAPMEQVQLTLGALLLAFGGSQMLWGPLSDRWGRRPILLAGLGAYGVAAVASTLAPDMPTLIVWRTLQGAAMGAAVMGARAIVRDCYSPTEGAAVMSRALSGLGVIACLSAPAGSLLAQMWGWRAALAGLAVFGTLTLAVIALRLPETLAQRNTRALHAPVLLNTWWQILRNPTFLAYSALSVASYSGLFTFLGASSFVFISTLNLSASDYGLVMLTNSLAYIAGTFLCRALLARLGVTRTVALAGVLTISGGLGWLGLVSAGLTAAWLLMLPQVLFMIGHGIHQPCGQTGAVGPFPQAAGAASALNGFLMMLSAFAVGRWLGTHLQQPLVAMSQGIAIWSVLISLTAWTLVRRYGVPRAH